ncbi:DUF2848 family protein [Amycolatopsis sp. NPDC023774]|uniref:DUF2848 family protein n=1 Tax=Amycolatopsis sp. NPDC023774 TaxID=3155015 RepID=UPI0033DABCC8
MPTPAVAPALYPVAPYLAQQAGSVPAQHGRTSCEAEWSLVLSATLPMDPAVDQFGKSRRVSLTDPPRGMCSSWPTP